MYAVIRFTHSRMFLGVCRGGRPQGEGQNLLISGRVKSWAKVHAQRAKETAMHHMCGQPIV